MASASVCQTVATLYDDLRAALLGSRQVDIHMSTRRFFDELFSLVVRRHVLGISTAAVDNRSAEVEVKHVHCLRTLCRSLVLNPFDGVDQQFALVVTRAIVASHAMLEALTLASGTVTAVTEHWMTSTGCQRELTTLRLCALCDGHVDWTSLRPCRRLCINVARRCLASVAFELGPRWERFVDGLSRLVVHTHGPRDLELVAKSLDGTVADGVLQVIRNAPHFYSQVNRSSVLFCDTCITFSNFC